MHVNGQAHIHANRIETGGVHLTKDETHTTTTTQHNKNKQQINTTHRRQQQQ
jgi:hypothetical protein